MERSSYTPDDQYITSRISSMGQLPTHRQVLYGRTYSARFNRSEFAGIEHYKNRARWAWSDLGYMALGLATFITIGYAIVRFIL